MSDILARSVWRARMARQTPRTINVVKICDPLENEVTKLKAEMNGVLDRNEELTSIVRNLRISRQRLLQELEAAKKILSSFTKFTGTEYKSLPEIVEIVSAVSREFDVPVEIIRSEIRTREVALARQAAMYLCRKISRRNYPSIGRFFSRDHSSAVHAIEKIESLRQTNSDLNDKLRAIENRFVELDAVSDATVSLTEVTGEPLRANAPISGS